MGQGSGNSKPTRDQTCGLSSMLHRANHLRTLQSKMIPYLGVTIDLTRIHLCRERDQKVEREEIICLLSLKWGGGGVVGIQLSLLCNLLR